MMGRTTRQADGDLLLQLSDDDRTTYKAPRGSQPATGTEVQLWRLPGTWGVWSPGPFTGTWWLKAVDEQARRTAQQLEAKPDRGLPVVVNVWRGSIAVASKDIRPAVLGGAR